MRKRLIALVFTTFLCSMPAFAGHSVAGGYCAPCDVPGCICEPGEDPRGQQNQQAPTGLGTEMLLVLAAFALVLRYKA